MTLPWNYAAGLAIASLVAGAGLIRRPGDRSRAVGAFLREAGIVVGLYAVWQLVRTLTLTSTAGAKDRAEWIRRFEATLHLPSEAAVQHSILWSPDLIRAANLYYATVHFPATIALLVWLYLRRRDRYGEARWALGVITLICLAIQFMPVAPPRLMPGFVDTGTQYGQSVYGAGWGAAQLSAMPSVHVAWALAVGWYVWRMGSRRWRWIGPLHAVVTTVVVVVTANHWWLDVIIAAAITAAVMAVVARWRRAWRSSRVPAATSAAVGPVGDSATQSDQAMQVNLVSGGGLELIRRPAHPEPQIRVFPRKSAGPSGAADAQIRDDTRTYPVGSTWLST